jgi:glycosyltransferase involved in cell wall biosynthesis
MKLRIAYLMEDTDLSGGVRVQLAQSDELVRRGHQVTIITKGAPLRWRSSLAEWSHVDDFEQVDPQKFDFLIATFWTTVRPAFDLAPDKTLHLCQGYEGDFTAYQDHSSAIEAVYRLPIPKIVVTPTLVPLCRRYCEDVTWIGQIVDEGFFQPRELREGTPRVLLVGASQIDFKGIDIGYGAALHARWNGGEFDLIRVSPWAPAGDEPVQEHVAEFHVGLDSVAIQNLFRSCDLFLGPSRRDEGFGLPAAEAMASGLPTILTRIPSFLSFAPGEDYALFADEDDAVALGEHLLALLGDEVLARELSLRGREVAEQFRAERTGDRLEEFLLSRAERVANSPSGT